MDPSDHRCACPSPVDGGHHRGIVPTWDSCCDDYSRTRRSLLARLQDWQDHDGWREFVDRYGRFIFNIARRSGLSREEAEDVLQDTMLSVAKKIPNFRYEGERGSFRAWLVMIVKSRIIDHLRKVYRRIPSAGAAPADREEATRLEERIAQQEDVLGHEAMWQREWEDYVLEAALERAKRRMSAKHFLAFRMCSQQQKSPSEVARSLGISLAKVYLIRHRATRIVAAEIESLREGK